MYGVLHNLLNLFSVYKSNKISIYKYIFGMEVLFKSMCSQRNLILQDIFTVLYAYSVPISLSQTYFTFIYPAASIITIVSPT